MIVKINSIKPAYNKGLASGGVFARRKFYRILKVSRPPARQAAGTLCNNLKNNAVRE
jgi:hypothetical protein